MTDETTQEEVQNLVDPPAPIERSIKITINDNRSIAVDISNEFKTYEFYGALVTTLIDVFTSTLVNEVVSKISTLAAANAGTNENVIKEQLMKAVQGMKL